MKTQPESTDCNVVEPCVNRARTHLHGFVVACLLTLLAAMPGCGEGDEKQQRLEKESKEALDALGDYAGDRLDKFMKAASDNFSQLDSEIDELKAKIADKSDAAAEKMKPLLEKAEAKRAELAEKVKDMKEGGEEEMKRLQTEVQKIYAECERLVREATDGDQ